MNRTTKAAVTAAATGALIVGGATASSATTGCADGQQMFAGTCQTVTVTETVNSGRPTVDDLMFRDENAVPTGSGMYANATFTTTGSTIRVNGIDYIEVIQDQKPGIQGYGPLYRGYVTARYTQIDG